MKNMKCITDLETLPKETNNLRSALIMAVSWGRRPGRGVPEYGR